MTRYEKYCSKCGSMQPIIPIYPSIGKTYGACYEKLHFVTKNPFDPKYEVIEK